MGILYLTLKKYSQCTFQDDLLDVIVTVFNIVQYWASLAITTLHSVLVLSCAFIYLPRQKHFNWFREA